MATSQGELASIQSNAKALLSNIDGVPTGASDVLDKYNDSVTALSSRSFSFSESNSSPYENGFNNQISSLSKGNEILNADYQIKGSVKNLGYDFEIASASKISGVADKLGSFGGVASSLSMGTATKSYSLFGAAAEKTINTSVSVNGKDISEIFQTTTNGVYQY